MRNNQRQLVQQRYDFRCGYCDVREVDTGSKLTIDHFKPRIEGGDDSLDNLVYCCHACNEFKRNYWRTEPNLRLLHPLLDDLTQHYVEQANGTLEALTPRGVNHILCLHLKREELIERRREKYEILALRTRCEMLEDRLSDLEQTTRKLQEQIARLFGDATR